MNSFRRRVSTEAGFTLVELMITIAIIGVITLPLANLVIEYFQNTVATQARASVSHDEQIVAGYFGDDVASIGRHNTDGTPKQSVWNPTTSGAPINCGAGISAFLALAWDEYNSSGGLSTSEAVYGTRTQSDNGQTELQLVRVHCLNSSTPDATSVLAHNLTGTPTVVCDVTPCSMPSVVSMTLSLRVAGAGAAPYQATVTGRRRQS